MPCLWPARIAVAEKEGGGGDVRAEKVQQSAQLGAGCCTANAIARCTMMQPAGHSSSLSLSLPLSPSLSLYFSFLQRENHNFALDNFNLLATVRTMLQRCSKQRERERQTGPSNWFVAPSSSSLSSSSGASLGSWGRPQSFGHSGYSLPTRYGSALIRIDSQRIGHWIDRSSKWWACLTS